MESDVRWLQRFYNLERAFARLREAMESEALNELERNGLVQRFEFTIELSWKTLNNKKSNSYVWFGKERC